MTDWTRPKLDAMTPLAIYDEQPDHFVVLFRAPKDQLVELRSVLERAYDSGDEVSPIPVFTELLRACRPALNEIYRRLDEASPDTRQADRA